MPRDKDLKRLVRARMKKTGESYTAARAQVTRKTETTKPKAVRGDAPSTALGAADYAARAGMSDKVLKEKTGCAWARWVKALDYYGADTMSHREIAALVHEKYEVGDWWAQTVAVGYERIKGLRARGQRRDGSYEATKSRTFNVPIETLFDAWANPAMRRKWMNGTTLKVRTATAPKSIRLDWPEGGIIAVGFLPKGKGKSSVALSHAKLPDRETVNRVKHYWTERLDALGEVLTKP